ncbi:myb/sant-like dna-binding domain [Holotrichia oblita]|uniref:Myb/sant-like dna-binding domain n=1 Tax=Holotrichia oblita TaxID=644536 RepID=A0ACB9SM17_HOLOL|nr:myb/sant-like dna-binding domain [Holotrichia oblita]
MLQSPIYDIGLTEFIVLPERSQEEVTQDVELDSYKLNHLTLLFLDLYKTYMKQVGSFKFKNLKKMYEEIAKELQSKAKQKILASHCENSWKHLERSYKKYVDNNKKTGRGRRDFEYANELTDILESKPYINPVLLLSSETVHSVNDKENSQSPTTSQNSTIVIKSNEHPASEANLNVAQSSRPLTASRKEKYQNKKVRADVLKEIRKDRPEYYQKRLLIEKKKLEEKKKEEKIKYLQNITFYYSSV